MRKKYLLMVIAGALVLATMIGGTLAALNVKSEEAATADISIKSVGVTIYDEQTPLGTLTEEKTTEIVPGTDVAMARKVVNSVSDGYDVYVKVVIYKNWEIDGEQLYPETGAADLLYVESGEKGRQDLAAAGTNEIKVSAECKYGNCTHRHEPGCAVHKAVEEHLISESRYTSYLNMLEDKEEGKYRAAY